MIILMHKNKICAKFYITILIIEHFIKLFGQQPFEIYYFKDIIFLID